MEVLFGRAFLKRFRQFDPYLKTLFAFAAVFTFLWLVAIFWVFSRGQVEFITGLQIDKISHFIGGVLAAGAVMLLGGVFRPRHLVLWVISLGILWEVWEVMFLTEQLVRFSEHFLWWFSDTFFDVIADVLGAYFWVRLYALRDLRRK